MNSNMFDMCQCFMWNISNLNLLGTVLSSMNGINGGSRFSYLNLDFTLHQQTL